MTATTTALGTNPTAAPVRLSSRQLEPATPLAVPRAWLVLGLLCAAQFMILLDAAIVSVALPAMGASLRFRAADLVWVVNAYTLVFGGCLLLGGRLADAYGRRRMFLVGVGVFTTASLGCGLAGSAGALVAARAVQGFGAALVSPAALSLLTTTFTAPAERTRALGVWSAVMGSGSAVGLVLGGLLTDLVDWRWIFLINVPIGAAVALLTHRHVAASPPAQQHESFDLPGAVTVTLGLGALVFAVVEGGEVGWTSGPTMVAFATAITALGGFVHIEHRAAHPLLPMSLLRQPAVATNLTVALLGAGVGFALFFQIVVLMQQALGYSPLHAGFAYLAVALPIVATATVARRLVVRLGVSTVLLMGLATVTVSRLALARVSTQSSYLVDLMPGLVLAGVGAALAFVAVTIIATAAHGGAPGVAGGLLTTAQQIGGALGVAGLSAVAGAGSRHAAAHSASGGVEAAALVAGFRAATLVGAAVAAIALLLTLAMRRSGSRRAPC